MAKTLTAIVLDTKTNSVEVKEIKDELNTFYEILGCSCFDIARRRIGGKAYDIIVDDIGLYAESPIVSAVNPFNTMDCLVGNLIIVSHKGENLASLKQDDIVRIYSHLAKYTVTDGGIERVVVLIG